MRRFGLCSRMGNASRVCRVRLGTGGSSWKFMSARGYILIRDRGDEVGWRADGLRDRDGCVDVPAAARFSGNVTRPMPRRMIEGFGPVYRIKERPRGRGKRTGGIGVLLAIRAYPAAVECMIGRIRGQGSFWVAEVRIRYNLLRRRLASTAVARPLAGRVAVRLSPLI